MAIEYVWRIENLSVIPQMTVNSQQFTNVVSQIWWSLTAKDGSHHAETSGAQRLPEPSMPFSDFENLTQEQVLGWLQTQIGEEEIGRLKANLALQIQRLINPPVLHKVPASWRTI